MKAGIVVVVAATVAIAMGAQAQVFKCKGLDGRVVYGDTPCEPGATVGALPPGVSNNTHQNEGRAAADRAVAAPKPQREPGAAPATTAEALPAATPPAAGAATPYELTSSDLERIRNLQVDYKRPTVSREQNAAITVEIFGIRAGIDSRLSAEERSRRESIRFELGATEEQKRLEALQGFVSLYRNVR